MNIHILDDWTDSLRSLPSFAALKCHDVSIWTDREPEPARLAERLAEADCLVLFRERTAIGSSLLSRLPKLKMIAVRGACRHIDLEACTRQGILVCADARPALDASAAAELAFALILADARNLTSEVLSMRAGKWQSAVGRTIKGKTIGLYGYGRIAKMVATYSEAFGMNVVWWGSEEGRKRAFSDGRQIAPSREAFFATSDIVSLHVRLTPQTRGIITEADLSTMKPDALFVNTARAELVAHQALLTSLDKGRPGRAALDVFEQEPIVEPDHPILRHRAILATPHLGYLTAEELDRQFLEVYELINAFGKGRPNHVANAEVLDR